MKKIKDIADPIYAKLFARPAFYPLNKALYHASLRGMGMMNCTRSTSGEKYFMDHVLPSLLGTDAPILFDVGANVGNYTQLLHRQFPKATIHAFEPHPKTFKHLTTNVSPFAQCHNSGLGSEESSLILYDKADQDGSTHASMHEKIITHEHLQQTVEHTVQVRTLDQVADKLNIKHIDFLKIDTEGYEFEVLEGATGMLETNQISIIQFEFGSTHCFSRNFVYDFKEKLPNHDLYRLLPKALLKLDKPPLETEIFGFQNIVALPKTSVLKR